MERYAKMHELPRRLESSIKLCFTFQHQKRIGQDEEILVRRVAGRALLLFWFGRFACSYQLTLPPPIPTPHPRQQAAIPMTMRSRILAHRYQMVAANEIFNGCQEHFVTSILAVLRPKILIPGVTIYNRDDMTREALFLEEGEVEVRLLTWMRLCLLNECTRPPPPNARL